MAKGSHYQKGSTIDFVNNGAAVIAYNEVVPMVTRIGIAGENIPIGGMGSIHVTEVWELPAVNNAAFNVGDQLYWDSTAGNLTNTATDNIPAGWCIEPKSTAATTAKIKIG